MAVRYKKFVIPTAQSTIDVYWCSTVGELPTPPRESAIAYVGSVTDGIPYVYAGGAWHNTIGDAVGPQGPAGANGTNGTNGTDAVLPADIVLGAGDGYRVARGVLSVEAFQTAVPTGLSTVLFVVASLETDPSIYLSLVSASAQFGGSGDILISVWKLNADAEPVPADTFSCLIQWIAFGT